MSDAVAPKIRAGTLLPLGFWRDPAYLALGSAAMYLLVACAGYAADYLTDGAIPASMLRMLAAGTDDPDEAKRRIIEAGLAHVEADGSWQLSAAVTSWNLTAAEVARRRQLNIDMAREAGLKRARDAKRSPDGSFARVQRDEEADDEPADDQPSAGENSQPSASPTVVDVDQPSDSPNETTDGVGDGGEFDSQRTTSPALAETASGTSPVIRIPSSEEGSTRPLGEGAQAVVADGVDDLSERTTESRVVDLTTCGVCGEGLEDAARGFPIRRGRHIWPVHAECSPGVASTEGVG